MIYGGAAPNQHVVPLAGWALPRYGHDVYCVGSNYVWSWETTRIMRELVEGAGGRVLRERYLPIGATDVDAILREVRDTAPDVVFNTLIGESSYAFYRAYHRLSRQEERFRAERRPILSCTLSEPEVQAIGPDAACGHIACSVYFQSIERAENAAFVRAFQSRFGAHRVTSADAEAAYVTTLLLATSLQAAGTDRVPEVKRATYDCRLRHPKGTSGSIPQNNHAWLTPRIGRATADGQFRVEWEAAAPSRPDPYLARLNRSLVAADGARPPAVAAGRPDMSPLDLAGRRALVLHRADHHRAALAAQLHRVGLVVCCLPPSAPLGQLDADFVFFDADVGHDCLFPWGRSPPPMPLVAILGTEAPGRLEWALAQSATAFMSKPIGSSGAFQALVVAARLHEQIGELRRSVAELSERLRARPLVVRAVLEVMRRQRTRRGGGAQPAAPRRDVGPHQHRGAVRLDRRDPGTRRAPVRSRPGFPPVPPPTLIPVHADHRRGRHDTAHATD